MTQRESIATIFKKNAEAVSAVVVEIGSLSQAFGYVIELCRQKKAGQPVPDGENPELAPSSKAMDSNRPPKVAAAGLDEAPLRALAEQCRENGISLVTENLRDHLMDLDIGFTFIDFGIAETGTLVLDSSHEDVRLATMMSDVHVAVLRQSDLYQDAHALEADLRRRMQAPPNYTAFITGASRTADIERVLALGVHGPLALHILLLEDQ